MIEDFARVLREQIRNDMNLSLIHISEPTRQIH
jgi:hypothetical protein